MASNLKSALLPTSLTSTSSNQYGNVANPNSPRVVSNGGLFNNKNDCVNGENNGACDSKSGIREVWKHNLEEEFRIIRIIVQKYKYIAVDTEYPGVVARPIGEFRSQADFIYQVMRCNVNLLRIIQLGFSFMDENGNLPLGGHSTWQFNFKFDINKEMSANTSIELLMNSGFRFDKHESDGIDPFDFAELLMSSGVVLVDDITFIAFHSDYDFGYMLRVLTNAKLPEEKTEFFELISMFFPNIYDVKRLIQPNKNFRNAGLQELADMLDVRRIGRAHQAGSDAMLTGLIFFKMKQVHYNGCLPNDQFKGLIYGLNSLKPADGEKDEDNLELSD